MEKSVKKEVHSALQSCIEGKKEIKLKKMISQLKACHIVSLNILVEHLMGQYLLL